MSKRNFLLLNLLWLAVIGGVLLLKQLTVWTGTVVLLETQPVDPRDLFRGDYVILSYEISDFDQIPDHPEYGNYNYYSGDTVYISLEKQASGIAAAEYKSPVRPEQGLYIKGRKTYRGVEFGIESYFVPEGEGLIIERAIGSRVQGKVVIDSRGNAVLTGLVMDGQEVAF